MASLRSWPKKKEKQDSDMQVFRTQTDFKYPQFQDWFSGLPKFKESQITGSRTKEWGHLGCKFWLYPNPQEDYMIFSKIVFSQAETKKKLKSKQPQSGIKILKSQITHIKYPIWSLMHTRLSTNDHYLLQVYVWHPC